MPRKKKAATKIVARTKKAAVVVGGFGHGGPNMSNGGHGDPGGYQIAAASPASAAVAPRMRTARSTEMSRASLAAGSVTFNGRRDLYEGLGYQRILRPWDYRNRYKRNAVAARIVEALPKSTWRGGGEVIEDEQPDIETPFELAWNDLNKKLSLWSMFQRTDVLAGLGRYAILLIGGGGAVDQPLKSLTVDSLLYLTPYSEEDATITEFEVDSKNVRYGMPLYYSIKRITTSSTATVPRLVGVATPPSLGTNVGQRVHYSRVIHIADGLLDDHVYGQPRLERTWNLLDDLEKVTGGGAEAFWKRADAGLHIDMDPMMELDDEEEEALEDEIEDYTHGLKRVVKTRGMKMNPLTSGVAGFKDPVDSIISQISAGTGIPQRILMGSERGQLASQQDRDNYSERVFDRRREFAETQVIRPFIDRMIELGVLPEPKDPYEIRWPEIQNLDEVQRADVAVKYATINSTQGEVVVTTDEIRDRILQLPARKEVTSPPAPTVPDIVPPEPGPSPAVRAARRVAKTLVVAGRWGWLPAPSNTGCKPLGAKFKE